MKASSPPKTAAFQVAEDRPQHHTTIKNPASTSDSGYHGLPEDEMDIDGAIIQSSTESHDTLDDFPHSPLNDKAAADSLSTDRSTTERSFHSAREELTKRDVATTGGKNEVANVEHPTAQDMELMQNTGQTERMEVEIQEKDSYDNIATEESPSSSQESSPARGLVRKSSLTFAALPAREPITTKKSIGNRTSRTSQLDQHKAGNLQNSLLERLTGGKSLGGTKQLAAQDRISDNEHIIDRPALLRDESDSDSRMTKLHNKSSTQRLHERINLLGKSQPPRPTKSIPALSSTTQPTYPDPSKPIQQQPNLTSTMSGSTLSTNPDDEDDWIQSPQQSRQARARPQLIKSISADTAKGLRAKDILSKDASATEDTTLKEQPGLPQTGVEEAEGGSKKSASLSRANFPCATDVHFESKVDPRPAGTESIEPSTTPIGTPAGKRYVDGPLSASKSRLQNIVKTAKGLFSSSANASAQAKLEAMSLSVAAPGDQDPSQHVPSKRESANSNIQHTEESSNMAPESYGKKAAHVSEPRKTRSSTEKEAREKEREAVDREQMEREKEKVRHQEAAIQANAQSKDKLRETRQPTTQSLRQSPRKTQLPENLAETESLARSTGPAPPEKSRQSQAQRFKDVRRPAKPAKELGPRAKEPPVNIKIGMKRAVPLNNTALSTNLQDTLQPNQTKQATITKKASNASIQSSGPSHSHKSAAPTQKPKALIVAERKKEQVSCLFLSYYT